MQRFTKAAIGLATAIYLAGCSSMGSSSGPHGALPTADTQPRSHARPMDTLGGGPVTRLLNILLGDAPPSFGAKTLAHLYVGVRRVDVSANGSTGTVAQYDTPQVIDLLQYQGSSGANMGGASTTQTTYSGVTFVVDIPSSQAVFTDGSTMPLQFMQNTTTYSSAGAGASTTTIADGPNNVDIVSNAPFTIPAGASQNVRVDFNAFESLKMSPAGMVTNPVLFVAPSATSGELDGSVLNSNGTGVNNAVVAAVDANGNVQNTALTAKDGTFQLPVLPVGTYNLIVYNAYTNAAGRNFKAAGQTLGAPLQISGASATVIQGQATQIGTIND